VDVHGRVYTWGSNEYGTLGLGLGAGETVDEPRLVEALEGIRIVDLSCGESTTAAVDSEGKAYSWGWGGSTMKGAGGLGHAGGQDEPTPRLIRTLVDQGVPIAKIECGELHTVALSTDGEIWAWGNGEYGRLGNGESLTCEVPEPIEFFANETIEHISVGRDFTFALTNNGELFAWGVNSRTWLATLSLAIALGHLLLPSDWY
jgi:alpha-tubulin suppressor-like RCC1 family protein